MPSGYVVTGSLRGTLGPGQASRGSRIQNRSRQNQYLERDMFLVALSSADASLAAVLVAAIALVFSVASFWWLNARRGKQIVTEPHAFVIAGSDSTVLILRFPVVIANSGARTTVVRDIQFRFSSDTGQVLPLPWRGTYSILPGGPESVREYPTPFAVPPREAIPLNIEFGGPFPGLAVEPGKTYSVEIEVIPTHRNVWRPVVKFDLPVPQKPWHLLAVHTMVEDKETRRRMERSSLDLLVKLETMRQENPPSG
jgi:hypothetical protein